MEKALRPAPLELLARWVFGELETRDTVLGIPKKNFALPDPRLVSFLFGRTLSAPLGVAAGPHTQLAQNIVSAWLCGARFIELKTVQILDEIAVSRPCIDAADETYNCEWSQELKLEESFEEYLNAWVLLHALAHKLGQGGPGTLFAMSVGYDLKGIRHPRVQKFIASMRDASAALPQAVERVARVYPKVKDLVIPSEISNHITLSTMHGCPPAEIERIARYLLEDLGVHTWVKLNPTLLGPQSLRSLLNQKLGFDIEVPDSAFAHDPSFEDALAMVQNLERVARGLPQSFGVKLSNTLEVSNRRPVFPPNEKTMYLSGRALHPLTLSLARKLIDATDGRIPVSFSGGADAENFPDLVADGLAPVTVCTDLLKPGGYARLQQYLENLEVAMVRAGADSLEAFVHASSKGLGARSNLARHLELTLLDPRYRRRERPLVFKGERALGSFDCIAAPCQEACPAHQNIPDYMWLVAQGQPSEALEVILRTNPQPGVTGSVCDHPCTERCVRNFYDAPLAIREVKRFAFERGTPPREEPGPRRGIEVAIVGAGPAGLSAAYYLARMGFSPVLFEAKEASGGMVSGVIPGYRLAGQAILNDLDRLRQLGVAVNFGRRLGRDLSLEELRRGFPYVFLAVGAQRGKRLGIPGEQASGVLDALLFLDRLRSGTKVELGERVLVIGGGNSAMDAARSARRLAPEGEVTLVYRRTRSEMPADPAEVRDCLEEGVRLLDLLAPARVVVQGGRASALACTPMKLGPPDTSGRPRPVPSGGEEIVLPADSVIPAIGQEPVLDFLCGLEVARRSDGTLEVDAETRETSVSGLFAGGDVARGAASVVKAIADGHAVATAIGRRHGIEPEPEPLLDKRTHAAEILDKKSRKLTPQVVPVLPLARRGGFSEVIQSFSRQAAEEEASRCLDCDDLCSLCVTVCPNRANVAYPVPPRTLELPSLVAEGGRFVTRGRRRFVIAQNVQVLNIGDFCNECGNCATFCPTSGAPYKDKPRFFIDPEGYERAQGDVFRLGREGDTVTLEARLQGRRHLLVCRPGEAEYRAGEFVARFDPASWSLIGWETEKPPAEGEALSLEACATLITLLAAEPALPRTKGAA
ncbi:MAG TPA: putative selenate reductase subunit YgfK [Anaeromyxobacteraceae bacterium]|nr:putative selenate reductase subunit YgfK [Anaeromyxobacteraceae bacterium]